MCYSEESIAYIRENCRFYAADIYSWLRIALDFAMRRFDYEGFGCVWDDRTSVGIDNCSVTVRSGISFSQKGGMRYLPDCLEHLGGGMYGIRNNPAPIRPRAVLLSLFSEELITRVIYCHRKQTIATSRGKVLSYTIEDTTEPDEVYMKATFDPDIYGDTPFDPLSVTRILTCFYYDIFENIHIAIH